MNFLRFLYNWVFKKETILTVYVTIIKDVKVTTGDLLFTSDAKLFGYTLDKGQFIGPTNHVIMYLGPDYKFIEAGPAGVQIFNGLSLGWYNFQSYRYGLSDKFWAVSKIKLTDSARKVVAQYCINQIGKPYNVNFLNSQTKKAFYCSQLIYWAYRKAGIDLLPRGESLLYDKTKLIVPFELWKAIEKKD